MGITDWLSEFLWQDRTQDAYKRIRKKIAIGTVAIHFREGYTEEER